MTRALIVDDAPENLYLLRTILEAYGWQVDEARHGVEALAAAAVRRPDIIVSDLLMPVMDGYALLARCRAEEALARIPFVVFTATYTDPRDEKLTLELGADGFILKPQEPDQLMKRLDAILTRDSAPRARPPSGNGEVRLAEYNEVLVRKLEQKAIEVEEANRELREAKAWLSQAVAAGRVGLWDWDLRTGAVVYSEEWKRQLGHEDHEIGGTFEEWKSRLHPEDEARVLEALERYSSNGAADLELEFRLRHVDGTYRTLLSRGRGERDAGGACVRLRGSNVDITERRELDSLLQQSQKMEVLGRLAAGVAHDFNNVLTVIAGTAELARAKVADEDPLRADLDEILRASERAAALTRQLLAFGRKQVLLPEVLDLNAVMADMKVMLSRVIGEDVDLVFRPAKDLGRVRADPGQISQVILNLAVNARDAMPGGGTITIETRNEELDAAYVEEHPLAKPGSHVMIAFTDTGCGMDSATLSRIFEPFFTTKPPGKGTGLGLSTVHGIVNQSGGTVWVYSEPGKGTTFRVYFPRVDAVGADRSARTAAAAHEPPRAEGSAADGTRTILVVEDERSLRNLAVRLLESAGYAVLAVEDGAEALRIVESQDVSVDLLLTDVVLPGMSGPDLARRCVQLRPELKVLFTSGYADDSVQHRGALSGEVHFIGKPYSRADLTRKVREVLGG